MKRISLLCIAFFGLILSTAARPIDLQTAQSIAIKFMGASDVQLHYIQSINCIDHLLCERQ